MITFGVVGTNWITDFFLDAIKEMHGIQLTAVYSRTEERAHEFAGRHDVETVFTNIEEMAKSPIIDAVYIASPNALHAEQAILFLEHGKHVLCEKPLASNTRETEMMIEAATRNHVVLMEAMKSTLHPNFKIIEKSLAKIGKVRRYFASYCKYSSRYDAYREGTVLNAFNPNLSNGSLMDLGVYCVYPMVALFGEPTEVMATGVVLESGVDGSGSILASYNGMDAVMLHSKISTSYSPTEIQGEDGTILIYNTIANPERVEIHYKSGMSEIVGNKPARKELYYEAEEFFHLIIAGKTMSSVNTFERSLITAKIMEAARREIGVSFPADKQQ